MAVHVCFAEVSYRLILPISFRITSPAPWQSYDCLSASATTLKDANNYLTWICYKLFQNVTLTSDTNIGVNATQLQTNNLLLCFPVKCSQFTILQGVISNDNDIFTMQNDQCYIKMHVRSCLILETCCICKVLQKYMHLISQVNIMV